MPIRLAALDVDGTLKEAVSPYQYLHRRLGVAQLAATNRQLALSGRIDYGEWLRRDVGLWAGQRASDLRNLLAENPYLPGARELLRTLKEAGIFVALVSAGFTLNTDPIVAEFGLDYALANQLGIGADGCLDGTAISKVPRGGEGLFLRELMARLSVRADEVLAAGDTQDDLELFECAGLRLAVNPLSEELRARADAVFEPDLTPAVAWLQARGSLPVNGGVR